MRSILISPPFLSPFFVSKHKNNTKKAKSKHKNQNLWMHLWMNRDDVIDAVEQSNYLSLLQEDQLTKEKGEGRVFLGYKEAEIMFPPSYKVQLTLTHTHTHTQKIR